MRNTKRAEQLGQTKIFTDIAVIENEAHSTDVRAWLMAKIKINGTDFTKTQTGQLAKTKITQCTKQSSLCKTFNFYIVPELKRSEDFP